MTISRMATHFFPVRAVSPRRVRKAYKPATRGFSLAGAGLEPPELRAELRLLTVLFVDMQGYTELVRTISPAQLHGYLNRFLSAMTQIVVASQGTPDKYIGDAVMAYWGAPLSDAHQANHAVAAALEMTHVAARLDAEFQQQRLPPLRIRIGINTGVAQWCELGSGRFRSRTVIGDPVNLAYRFQTVAKQARAVIAAGAATVQAAGAYRFRSLGNFPIGSRSAELELFEPIGQAGKLRHLDLPFFVSHHLDSARQTWPPAGRFKLAF